MWAMYHWCSRTCSLLCYLIRGKSPPDRTTLPRFNYLWLSWCCTTLIDNLVKFHHVSSFPTPRKPPPPLRRSSARARQRRLLSRTVLHQPFTSREWMTKIWQPKGVIRRPRDVMAREQHGREDVTSTTARGRIFWADLFLRRPLFHPSPLTALAWLDKSGKKRGQDQPRDGSHGKGMMSDAAAVVTLLEQCAEMGGGGGQLIACGPRTLTQRLAVGAGGGGGEGEGVGPSLPRSPSSRPRPARASTPRWGRGRGRCAGVTLVSRTRPSQKQPARRPRSSAAPQRLRLPTRTPSPSRSSAQQFSSRSHTAGTEDISLRSPSRA